MRTSSSRFAIRLVEFSLGRHILCVFEPMLLGNNMLDFRPPLDSPLLISLMKLVFPIYMKTALHDTAVQVVDGGLEKFAELKGQRALICPNHSNRHDPAVMFELSRLTGENFNFVAAREVFDWYHGLNGWWLQHMGTYSVVRGAPDRESFKTTRRILSEGKKKLVLFPEGEISRQNDTLMPLESGATQLCFWAMSDVEKIDPEATIHIQPIALKYTYRRDISQSLKRTLSILEDRLDIKGSEASSLYARLRALAETLLTALENEYDRSPAPDSSINDRVDALRHFVLATIARNLTIDLPRDGRELEAVRILRNAVDDVIYDEESHRSEYEKRLHEERASALKGYYKDLGRVVNFIAIYDGYLRERMTQERFADIVDRLEIEILGGEPAIKGPRLVLIDVGDKIDLRSFMPDYKKDKKGVANKVTDEIFRQISSMLARLDNIRSPMLISA